MYNLFFFMSKATAYYKQKAPKQHSEVHGGIQGTLKSASKRRRTNKKLRPQKIMYNL